MWRSCCFEMEKECVMFICVYVVLTTVVLFCMSMLVYKTECSEQQSYMALLSTILGVFVPTPGLGKMAKLKRAVTSVTTPSSVSIQ
jgi:hypothetical protein